MEQENSQSDVSSNEGQVSAPDSGSSAPSQDDTGSQEAASSPSPATPFHEHPRFQELISQKKELAEQVSNYSRQMQEMQRQLQSLQQAPSKTEDPLLARLKSIDPEFGSRFEKLASLEQKVQQFEEWQTSQQLQAQSQQVSSSLDNLYTQHSIPKNMQSRYEREISAIAAQNPDLRPSDLPKVFKMVHDEYTQFINDFKRQERESYVKEKSESKTPSTVSGGTAASNSGNSNNSPMTKAQAIAQIASEMRAAKQKI